MRKRTCVGSPLERTGRDRRPLHGPEGLADPPAPGHPGKLNTAQREALAAMVESGPMPAIHGVVRWRLKDLAMWGWEGTTTIAKMRAKGLPGGCADALGSGLWPNCDVLPPTDAKAQGIAFKSTILSY